MKNLDNAKYSCNLMPRILRDVDDGVLALDKHGCIIYINPQAAKLLGVKDHVIGEIYAEVFFDGTNKSENDSFHQFILDAVYHKDRTHQGTIRYVEPGGKIRYLKIKTSFLKDDETDDKSGIVMVISDVTEAEILRKKKHEATIVFVSITLGLCMYLFFLAIIDFLGLQIHTKALTQVINGIVVGVAVVIYKKTDFSTEELGLKLKNPKSTFGLAIAISSAIVLLLIVAKYIAIILFPDFFDSDTPFWNWNIGLYSWISYIFTCVLQEFLARSMIYGSIKKLLEGRKAAIGAIILSSILFGAVHIAHGFVYMLSAIILLGSLGGLYEKQRNIWGVTVIHFILGQAAHCLGFIS